IRSQRHRHVHTHLVGVRPASHEDGLRSVWGRGNYSALLDGHRQHIAAIEVGELANQIHAAGRRGDPAGRFAKRVPERSSRYVVEFFTHLSYSYVILMRTFRETFVTAVGPVR